MCIDVDMYSPFDPSNIYCGAIFEVLEARFGMVL